MLFETDLCVDLGPSDSPMPALVWDPTRFLGDYDPSDISTNFPPPNEDDQSEDRVTSMTVSPTVYYLVFLRTNRFFCGVCVSSDLTCACVYVL